MEANANLSFKCPKTGADLIERAARRVRDAEVGVSALGRDREGREDTQVGIAPACLPGIVDTQIANAIDEHLRAIDRLCRFGIDGGFGKKHPVKEY